jgi:hypothetical protein
MEESLRGPLVVLEVVLLGVVTALVEDDVLRVGLALLIALLLARAALGTARAGDGERGSPDERREDHLYRHWVNALLKKVREFHTVCKGIGSGGVNLSVGELRLRELEKEIQNLMTQVTESAKPARIKRGRFRAGAKTEKRQDAYGELSEED